MSRFGLCTIVLRWRKESEDFAFLIHLLGASFLREALTTATVLALAQSVLPLQFNFAANGSDSEIGNRSRKYRFSSRYLDFISAFSSVLFLFSAATKVSALSAHLRV